MVEFRDEEDGRIALIMDKGELPVAVEALMRAGYGLTPPSANGDEQPQAEAEAPEQPEAEAEAPEEPEAEAEEPEDFEAEDEEPEAEDEEPQRRNPVRRRGARARRLWLTRRPGAEPEEAEAQHGQEGKRANG